MGIAGRGLTRRGFTHRVAGAAAIAAASLAAACSTSTTTTTTSNDTLESLVRFAPAPIKRPRGWCQKQ
jgi:hypothetical protein